MSDNLSHPQYMFNKKQVFHYQVHQALLHEGFLFIRSEVPMPIEGQADFVAYHAEQMAEYVIECKVEPFKTHHCSQVWDYAQQLTLNNEKMPEYKDVPLDVCPQMALAYPIEYVDSIHWEYCKRIHIWIILIGDGDEIIFPVTHPAHDVLLITPQA